MGGLNIFRRFNSEECFYTVSLEPNMATKAFVIELREGFEAFIESTCFNLNQLPLMPLLGFPFEKRYERKLTDLLRFELGQLANNNLVEIGSIHAEECRGLIGFELNLSENLHESLEGIKHALIDIFNVDVRYLQPISKPCLVFAKNLPPFAFNYVLDKIDGTKLKEFGYTGFTLARQKKENLLTPIMELKLA